LFSGIGHGCGVGEWTYLVPACLRHTVDIGLVRTTSAIDDTVPITVAVADAGAPVICYLAVAGGVFRAGGTGVRGDVRLRLGDLREAQ
jgi:hypothetical protein